MASVEASGTPQQAKPPRDFYKCRFCRDKKRKCDEYDFERGERCRNCIAGDKPCGPRVPHCARDASQTVSTPLSTPSTSFFSRSSSSLLSSSFTGSSRPLGSVPYTPSPAAATPNFPTLDSSQRPKSRWSFSQDASHEARAPSAKDVVRTKLVAFGYQSDLFESLTHRLQAAVIAQPDMGLRPHDEVENMIKSLLDLAREKCTLLCEQILNSLPQVTSRTEKELFLRGFVDKVAYFLALAPAIIDDKSPSQRNEDAADLPQCSQGDDFQDIKFMHYFAASQLVAVVEESGDFSEALRQKRRLATLGQCYRLPDHAKDLYPSREDFEKLSVGIAEAFKCLRIPVRFARLLPKVDNIFPPTHLAVQHQYADTALDLLKSGADPQACDILKRQAIQIAAETGNLLMLQLALGRHEGAKSARDIFEQTALCIAAYMGNLDIFTQLLAAGDDMSVRDVARRSVLAIASGAGHFSIVQYLLQNGSRPNDTTGLQSLDVPSALHTAARGGHTKCADILLEHRASALVQCQGLTPAQVAAAQCHKDLAERLYAAEREQESHLPDQILLGQRVFMDSLVDDTFLSQISSSSTSPYTVPPAMTPSLPVAVATPLHTSVPTMDHSNTFSRDIVRSLSRTGSAATSSPRLLETSSPSASAFSRKRSHPSTSHQSSPCPSDISSQNSSVPLKRHQTSKL